MLWEPFCYKCGYEESATPEVDKHKNASEMFVPKVSHAYVNLC